MQEKSEISIFQTFVQDNFPQSDLTPSESHIYSDVHLRFELGDDLENGTRNRVEHCRSKALAIFEDLFDPEDDIWVMVQSSHCPNGIDLWSGTEGYLLGQFLQPKEISKQVSTEVETLEIEADDGTTGPVEYRTTHTQRVYSQKVNQLAYRNIITGIANLEMGFDPSISDRVYFIHESKRVAFYMYDDRGCLVFGHDRNSIRFLYTKYTEWLVNYHREYFDRIFKEA